MNKYNVICPVCGAVNRNLYLEETRGWMECESCGCAVDLRCPVKKIVPAFKEQLAVRINTGELATAQ